VFETKRAGNLLSVSEEGARTTMVEWLKNLVVGDGNVIRERSYTNWNTFDDSAVVAEKMKETSGGAGGKNTTGGESEKSEGESQKKS
jgi:hypothetical protein